MRYLSKYFIEIFLIVCFLSACKKESERLPPALEAEINKITDCSCSPYIEKYSWRGEIVYFRLGRGANCSFFPLYYNKDGYKMEMEIGYTVTKFREEARLIGSVYECIDALTPH